MNKISSVLFITCGAALATATAYDASTLAALAGVPVHGGEGVIALASLSLSTAVIAFGMRGLHRSSPRKVSQYTT